MSWLTRFLGVGDGGPSSSRDPLDDFWYHGTGRRSSVGVNVTHEKALTVPVVYDCLKVLSETVAQLPHNVFERLPNGDKRPADNHPLVELFRSPDGESTSHEWIAQLVWDLASEGNFVGLLQDGPLGPVSRIMRVEPGMVEVERLEDGSRRWTVRERHGASRRYVEGEVWHVRKPPLMDQLVGASQMWVGREAIGALLSLMEFSANYLENDAVPPIMIKHPGHFADDASRRNFLAAVAEWMGRRRRKPAVLEHGMEIEKLGNTPEQSQFLETRQALQEEVARIWRMPPHKVGIMDKATFSNIEHQALEFVTDTIAPWLDLIEGAINRHLMLAPRRYFFEFNVGGLLRGDIKARFEAYATARQWGWLSVNEIRRLENMNPIGRPGDQYLQPLNMAPAGAPPQAEAMLWGPRGEVFSRRIGGEWQEVAHGA